MIAVAVILWICAGVVALYGFILLPFLILPAIGSGATVLQQISAQLALGLTTISFVLLVGFASLIQIGAGQRRALEKATERMITNIRWEAEKLSGRTDAVGPAPEPPPAERGFWW